MNRVGRKKLNITVKNISDALREYLSVADAAKALNCSKGYIYQELKTKGLKPRELF